jgi:hypothetical protein
MREQPKESAKKTSSVWDYKDRPSIMAKDQTLRRSQSAIKGRVMHGDLPAHMWIFKEKK